MAFFHFFDGGFAQIFSQIASITVEKLRNRTFISSRHVKGENTSLPVDMRCSKTSLLKLPSSGSRPSDKGGRGGHPDPDTRGEVVSKNFFSALRTLVWYKIRGGGPPPLDPPLYIAVCIAGHIVRKIENNPWFSRSICCCFYYILFDLSVYITIQK